MEETKKQAIAIVISLFALVLLAFAFGAIMQRSDKQLIVAEPDIMDCDSLRNEYLQVYIEYTRDEIILDRLYKKDSVLYNELTTNLE